MNTEGCFDLGEGVFRTPYTGTYLLSVHAKPVSGATYRVQLHRNGLPVAIMANGRDKGQLDTVYARTTVKPDCLHQP